MAFAMQTLLRLPPSLRCQILTNAPFLSLPLDLHQQQARLILRRSYAQAKPPPKPRRKVSGSPTQPNAAPPATPRPTAQSSRNPYADRLCHNTDIALLYNSPKHTGYAIGSYLFAAIFFVGGFNTALSIKEPKKSITGSGASTSTSTAQEQNLQMSWTLRLSFAVGATMFAAMGTMFMLAPTKMIRRIWLARPSATPAFKPGSYVFKIETKGLLPFRSGRTISTDIANVSVDREIRAQPDLYWNSVPLASSVSFTQHYLHHLDPSYPKPSYHSPPAPSILARVSTTNASLLRIWPAIRNYTRRMWLREGIAYLHVIGESGQWKMDLRNCEMLDAGVPIEKLMRTDVKEVIGVLPFLRGLFGGGQRGM